jgi:hypothetical protein
VGNKWRHPVRRGRRLPPPPGFNTWKSAGGPPQPDGVAGLADALSRLQPTNWPVHAIADHGTHEAIYIDDPDGAMLFTAALFPHLTRENGA